MTATKNPAPRKRWSCFAIPAICLAIPALLVGWMILIHRVLPAPPLVISEETTRITGPLTAEGYVDYFKALEELTYPPELATDENGYRVFVRLFGDLGSYHDLSDQDREFYRRQKYEKLGLDPDLPPTLALPEYLHTVLKNYYEAKGEERWYLDQDKKEPGLLPWTLEEYPMLADWVNSVNVPLDAIAEALRKPVFVFPMLQGPVSMEAGTPQNLYTVFPSEMQLFRSLARFFGARAGYRIGQGDIDGAIEDRITIHRLGRLIAQSGSTIPLLVGLAIEGMAWTIPVGANPEHPFTEQQIRCLLEGLDALPPLPPINVTLELERYIGLSAIQSVRISDELFFEMLAKLSGTGENSDLFSWLFDGQHQRRFNWNTIYRRINEVYDAAQEPLPRARYHAIMSKVREPIPNFLDLILDQPKEMSIGELIYALLVPGAKDTLLADLFVALLLPHVDVLERAIHRAECMENLQRLALAILLYELERGTMPDENWAVQIEPYLAGTPAQYLSCPADPSVEGMTRYALIQYGDALPANPDTLLLFELAESVPFAEAVITVDEILERQRWGSVHPHVANTAYRSGTVRFLSRTIDKEELLRLLGREEE